MDLLDLVAMIRHKDKRDVRVRELANLCDWQRCTAANAVPTRSRTSLLMRVVGIDCVRQKNASAK
jgi:hypothetical protein